MTGPGEEADPDRPNGPTGRLATTGGRLVAALASVRADPARRRFALAGGVVLGLAVSAIHWTGLVAGGALVGLSRRSVRRAIVAAASFGCLAVAVGVLATPGLSAGEFLALRRLAVLTLVVGVFAPVWGALSRVLV